MIKDAVSAIPCFDHPPASMNEMASQVRTNAENANQANQDAITQDLLRMAAQAQGYFRKPTMLGGGDKGAAGCLVMADAADGVKKAVDTAYPRSRPDFADKYAVHTCKVVDGIVLFEGKI